MASTMKKLSILIVCFSISSFLYSQTFGPIGTKWGYDFIGVGGAGSYHMEAVADTVIAGKTCRKLVTQKIWYICMTCRIYSKGASFIYENKDTLWGISPSGTLSLIFRYNLQIGDTFSYSPTIRYIVTRKLDTLVGGQMLKKWQLRSLCTSPVYSNQNINFVEKIGSLSSVLYLGYYCFSDPDYYDLCTFSSENVSIGTSCRYTKTTDLSDAISLNIQPNPVFTFLKIETEHPFSDFKIYDLTGKLVQKGVYTEGGNFDVSTFAQGVYILQLIDKQQLTVYRKFVKS
jgi:hypothetical protein